MTNLRTRLLRWYRQNRRDLPWRRTRDPYAIWISEAMLQQTRVESVIPYYERFLRRFPDLESLAGAELEEVLGEWAGLGYYSRARNLKRAAETVMDRFGGELPQDAKALQTLPGVGRYTAGALASIAFDHPEPVLDGNVTRVLARLHGIRGDVGTPRVKAQLWQRAEALVQGPHPGELNQALMELGACICTPRAPRCGACPVARDCVAGQRGDPESLPNKARQPKPRRLRATAAWLVRRGRVLAVRRSGDGLLAGLWELPGAELSGRERAESAIGRALEEGTGLAVEGLEALGCVERLYTHRRLELHVFRGRAGAGRVRLAGYEAHRWIAPSRFEALAQGRATREAAALALAAGR